MSMTCLLTVCFSSNRCVCVYIRCDLSPCYLSKKSCVPDHLNQSN